VKKAWVVTVDMGYGHQRAAYPLKDIAYKRIITVNSDKLVTEKEQRLWRRSQGFYEVVSRFTSMPVLGSSLFKLFDKLQAISDFYPSRDLSKPNLQALYLYRLIKKKKLNQSLIEFIKRNKLPFVATHLIPALIAEYNGLTDIYCVVTDTDINRAWLPKEPKKTRITYLAPCEHAFKRLKQYGTPKNRIVLTGFPLPKENLGGRDLHVLKRDLGNRLPNLDPNKRYISHYKKVIKGKLGRYYKTKSNHVLTLTFMIGGAGAQREIGLEMLKSLKKYIMKNKIRINLVAGTRLEIAEYYREHIISMGLKAKLGKNLNIIFAWNKPTYFRNFNYVLHTTDILWTKPSELCFYTALGLPIIMAPPIGSQEYYNQKWIRNVGSGFNQEKPEYTNEWLYDWLESGRLAEAAFEGFLEAPKLGTYNIERVVFSKKR